MTSKAQALLPQVLFLCCFVRFWYIPIHSYNHFSTENEYTHIFSDYSRGNFGELRSRMSRLWSLFSTLRSSLSHVQFPYPLSRTPLNFAHASWTTSRCATHRLVFFACYRSSQTGKDCPKLVNTISKLFHINSYQFHLNFTIE